MDAIVTIDSKLIPVCGLLFAILLVAVRLLGAIRELRRDFLHASIDLHERALQLCAYQRMMLQRGPRPAPETAPLSGPGTPAETPEEWLERMRREQALMRRS